MEALNPASGLDLAKWGLRTNQKEIPLHCQFPSCMAARANVRHCLISKGSLIEGEVIDSILSPGVRIGQGASVRRSILLHESRVEQDCLVEDVILDKYGTIGRGARVGNPDLGDDPNSYAPHLLYQGTTVIGKAAAVPPEVEMGRNCLVFPGVRFQKRPGEQIPAGSTFFIPEG